ncbi:MAG TPA: DUF4242 domain-containing protein [Steroidobacteraceae bacterium]|jgi:hypothetical protein
MKRLIALLPALFLSQAFAGDVPAQSSPAPQATHSAHRYLIERTFPPGALDGLDAAGKAKINSTNAKYGVRWVTSYANAKKTKTYCIYEAPSEAAVREAAGANGIPVDTVTEVPVTLSPN